MKKPATGAVLLALVIGALLLYRWSAPVEEVPEVFHEFTVQGVLGRTIAYYYFPGIYGSLYDADSNQRLVSKAKGCGADFILLRAFYNCTEEGEFMGDTEEAKRCLEPVIEAAHREGVGVFLSPFVESMEFWPEPRWTLGADAWTSVVVEWAEFAEENGVEMFAPGFEMALILDAEKAEAWFPDVLPRIREVYSGKVGFAEIPYGYQWERLNGSRVFEGYDFAGITIFPWKDYDGVHDMRSLADLGEYVESQAKLLESIGEYYGFRELYVATLGMDFWHGGMPSAEMRARGYEVALDTLRNHNVTGVFLHIWASEHDHLGDETDVKGMLRGRWTK
ncbi:hypothetical protein KAU18_08510 [Candidatus Bathyarchaeota archaeon]|nr:hypothetical protein [Candidatus Bathyarchaeota archaeon]